MNMLSMSSAPLAVDRGLPGLNYCPVTTQLIKSLIGKTKAPVDLIMISTLTTYSVLLQGIIDVERPSGGKGPVSLFTLAIAESGERKSTIAKLLEKPILDFQKEENQKFANRLAEFEVELDLYEEEKKYLHKLIQKKRRLGEETEILKEKLHQLQKDKPLEPKRTQILFEDATPEAIAAELQGGWRSAALVSNEGATILSGRAVHDLAMLNKLWSAEAITVNRKTTKSFMVDDARLTFSVMVQPTALSRFLSKKGEESRGIGFLARFLVCNPASTQGNRHIRSDLEDHERGYSSYIDRVECILGEVKSYISNSKKEKKLVRFSPAAKADWIALYNSIESEVRVNGKYQYAKDHASKLAENIARIAAVLTYIEQGEDTEISQGILFDAKNIALYFSGSFLKCFNVLPEYEKDVYVLRDYLQYVREGGDRYLKKNKIRQSGPSRLRSKFVLDAALLNLNQLREISVLQTDKGMVVIDLFPALPADAQQWNSFCIKNNLMAVSA